MNISSGTGSLAWSTSPNPQFNHDTDGISIAYRSSTIAVNSLTVYFAQALAADRVQVNALAPACGRQEPDQRSSHRRQ